ncbi:MAG: PilT/PilU family type 4a pilus ATPase [Planctomycetales bacterium]
MDIHRLLEAMIKFKASDLHLQADSPPQLRISGTMTSIDLPSLSAEDVGELIRSMSSEEVQRRIQEDRSADFSYTIPDMGRFRVNAFFERGRPCAALRIIPLEVPQLEDLNLPKTVEKLGHVERGLVLVTGTTGSGKSTTLAALVDRMNRHKRLRIITIEDPIEFVHESKKCLIAQRELGGDTHSFANALRVGLRQDPDVILVGELRDLETMRIALQAADTGHLVLSTLHTANATQTIQRLLSMFPADESELLIMQLALNLEAVICQRLAKTPDGERIPVVEILTDTPFIKKLIREGRISELPEAVGSQDQGMQLFDQHLIELYNAKKISGTEAMRLATNPERVALAMRGITPSTG